MKEKQKKTTEQNNQAKGTSIEKQNSKQKQRKQQPKTTVHK